MNQSSHRGKAVVAGLSVDTMVWPSGTVSTELVPLLFASWGHLSLAWFSSSQHISSCHSMVAEVGSGVEVCCALVPASLLQLTMNTC